MKKVMFGMTAASGAVLLVSGAIYCYAKLPALLSLAITAGTVFYHFAIRLAVGYTVNGIFHNDMDYRGRWFRQLPFEPKLYDILNVKAWKKNAPTFSPESFKVTDNGFAAVIGATCQAEVVHEIIMVLSLFPILLIIPFGAAGVFIATSVAAFLFDGVFVILQRYNRPRLIRSYERLLLRREQSMNGKNRTERHFS